MFLGGFEVMNAAAKKNVTHKKKQLPLLREEGWDLKREPKKTSTRKNRI